jgi:hypothetical protein
MLDMEAIVRRQDQEHCSSITFMIRHYVARRAQVTEGHPHNADERLTERESSALPQRRPILGNRTAGTCPRPSR